MGYPVSGEHVGPVPTLGQHTDEVLRGALGYDDATIDALRQHGA